MRVTSHKEGDFRSHIPSERKNKMFSFEKKTQIHESMMSVEFIQISVKYFTIYDHELCYTL